MSGWLEPRRPRAQLGSATTLPPHPGPLPRGGGEGEPSAASCTRRWKSQRSFPSPPPPPPRGGRGRKHSSDRVSRSHFCKREYNLISWLFLWSLSAGQQGVWVALEEFREIGDGAAGVAQFLQRLFQVG